MNLWKVVRLAKDLNTEGIPAYLALNDVPIALGTSAEWFARLFSDKIKASSSNNVYES